MTASTSESQDIEQATSAVQSQPDSKTRRYDRQLRLWAASGQAALESSRILVLSAGATATSILKNLVLPGIGQFTLLDPAIVSPADAGNNFFLNADESIGKPRAQEAVPLLRELNDSVDGEAVLKDIDDLLRTDEGKAWITSFSLVIAHNLEKSKLDRLSELLWSDISNPPLIVVRSAGFVAEFFIQFREQCVSQPHTDAAPSLRILRPFPTLKQWALDLDLDNMDPTTHAHVPFVPILVRAVEQWRNEHGGALPSSYADKEAFKAKLRSLKVKPDEENFEEAEAQAWRAWSEPAVPSEIVELFTLPPLAPSSAADAPVINVNFHALLHTLSNFVSDPTGPGTLPLSASLPDMKTDTESYVRLQILYREWAKIEKTRFKELLAASYPKVAKDISDDELDTFLKNAHHLRVLRGKQWGAWDKEPGAIAASLQIAPRETGTHLALTALSTLLNANPDGSNVTEEALRTEIQSLVGGDVELPEEVDNAIGEVARAPTADLPNTAAFIGGMVAQEAIKMITQQYIPVNGYCVIDLVDSTTGVVG